MAYKIRPGIVRVRICGKDLLVAKRSVWEECPRVRVIPKLWAACWAVVRAHLDFHRMRVDFKADRDRNQAAAVVPNSQILSPINLLGQYYAKGRHTYGELKVKSEK